MPLSAKIFALPLAPVLTFLLMGNALAEPSDMFDSWCTQNGGELLYLEQNSIGFNEHTVCELQSPLVAASSIKTQINCANIYFVDGEVVRAFEKTVLFKAQFLAPDELHVTTNSSNEPVVYRRCSEQN